MSNLLRLKVQQWQLVRDGKVFEHVSITWTLLCRLQLPSCPLNIKHIQLHIIDDKLFKL